MLAWGLIAQWGWQAVRGWTVSALGVYGELVRNIAGLAVGSRLVADDCLGVVIHFPTAGLFR
jgi:hypothetical protein